jgi:uncharacterized cupredoxin-like copper-binding protein
VGKSLPRGFESLLLRFCLENKRLSSRPRPRSIGLLVRLVSFICLAACGVLLAGGLSACGSRPAASARARPARISVKEKDFRILLQPARVVAGRVRFTVRDVGPGDHELILVRAHRMALPLRTDGLTVDEDAVEPETVAALEPARPGTVRELEVTLRKGYYEVFCNMAGHYMGGMRALLVVT